MVDKELHPVIKLLLARMDSNPEEFKVSTRIKLHSLRSSARWTDTMDQIFRFGSAEELAVVGEKYNRIQMDDIYEQVMDELCNGDERRAEERQKQDNLNKYGALGGGSGGGGGGGARGVLSLNGNTSTSNQSTLSPSRKKLGI